VRADGKDLKSQAELAGLVAAVWLTPQMDRLFLDGPSARRKFLDRLVYAFDPAHAARVSGADKAARERLALLRSGRPDPGWLSALEARMAEDFTAIAAARLMLAAALRPHTLFLRERESLFPSPLISVEGPVESLLEQGRPALKCEEELKDGLRGNRALDAESGRTTLGAHRADMRVTYADKGTEAARCSTGEQKGLLVSLILAHALLMRAEKGFTPLLLLDEIAAHLDAARLNQMFSFLGLADGQVWLTGTDPADFSALKGKAFFLSTGFGDMRAQEAL
jgi:DNA replication and repair protein RecF